MKKFTLIAACAAIALGASAQKNVEPGIATVQAGGSISDMVVIALDVTTTDALTAAGVKIESAGPDDQGRNLWVWDNTFQAGDALIPGVDMQFDGYVSLVVGTAGWSGAGYNVVPFADAENGIDYKGVNTTTWTDETHFHIAYYSPGTPCPSIAFIIADGEPAGSSPAKVAVGTAFVDGGSTYPTIGAASNDDWQGVDVTFADLKKYYPTFNYVATDAWTGNILSFLGGGTAGQTLALDAIYFYNYAGAGVEDIENNVDFVITNHTINAMGANAITLYDLAGKEVKSVAGTTMGIDNVAAGIYIVRAGNAVRKVVIK